MSSCAGDRTFNLEIYKSALTLRFMQEILTWQVDLLRWMPTFLRANLTCGNLVPTCNPRAQEMEGAPGIQSYPVLCVQIQGQPEVLEMGWGKEERECLWVGVQEQRWPNSEKFQIIWKQAKSLLQTPKPHLLSPMNLTKLPMLRKALSPCGSCLSFTQPLRPLGEPMRVLWKWNWIVPTSIVLLA